MSLRPADTAGVFYLERLAVLPACRHRGFGRRLVDHAVMIADRQGGHLISIGIIAENRRLKRWYAAYGFAPAGTREFPHLPFTVCYMTLPVGQRANPPAAR